MKVGSESSKGNSEIEANFWQKYTTLLHDCAIASCFKLQPLSLPPDLRFQTGYGGEDTGLSMLQRIAECENYT